MTNWRTALTSWQTIWLLPALGLGLLLTFFPDADLAVSALFYTDEEGFFLGRHPLVRFIYHSQAWLAAAFLLPLLTVLIVGSWRRATRLAALRKPAAYLLLVLVLGSGLIVNAGLKNHWDRARPSQIEAFGGTRQFTPALVPSDQCERNCSFVGGHAALGFSLLALGFVARRRRLWLGAGVALGAILGATRIVQGGHFLSDIVFSYVVIFSVAWIVHALMYRTWRRARAG